MTADHAEQRFPKTSRACDASTDGRRVLEAARVYLRGGAWERAHGLLEEAAAVALASPDVDARECETVGLMLLACMHLGHAEHLDRGTTLLTRALAESQPLSAECRALAVFHTLRRLADRGQYDRARALAWEARAERSQQISSWMNAHLELVLARVDSHLGDLDAAEGSALRAVQLAESDGCDALLGDALTAAANVLSNRRDLNGAQRLLARASAAYWRAGDAAGRSSALLNRGLSLFFLGWLRDSEAMLVEAREAAHIVGRQATALRARLTLGWLAGRRGELQRARSLLLSGWREARCLHLPREEAASLEYLAEAYLVNCQGAWRARAASAVRLCSRMAEHLAPTGDLAVEARIRMAMLAHADGDLDGAVLIAQEAIDRARKIGMRWEEAEALRSLGCVLADAGHTRDAREAFGKSLQILGDMGERFEHAFVTAWIQALDASEREHGWQQIELAGDPGPSSSAATEAALRSVASSTQRGSIDEEDTLTRSLAIWLEHPVWGPSVWLARRAAGGGRMEVDTAGAASEIARSHGAAAAKEMKARGRACRCAKSLALHSCWERLGLLTRSPSLLDLLRSAQTYAAVDLPVLILGETGTGKDLLARGLHELSGQPGRYVPINCATAQRQLFAAELFGARRGAFTGAIEHRRGLVHEAAGGTLFFDEIADLDPEAQGYLLRFLDSGEVRALGETRHSHVATRVLAATRWDLAARVGEGLFREDLYARLAAVVLRIPPLRSRSADLPLLIRHFWDDAGGSKADLDAVVTPDVLRALSCRPWPGNVRELKMAVATAVPLLRIGGTGAARNHVLDAAGRGWGAGFPPKPSQPGGASGESRPSAAAASPAQAVPAESSARGSSASQDAPGARPGRIFPVLVKDPDGAWPRTLLLEALETAKGHVPTAARILGISRSQAYRLYRRLRFQA
ncbi:MAG: sigma-54-dependent Fis family transcriptional regulator [Candidatus Eisenbacteria bacterium]|uniref:Sigma-54-dependent Fis family transcriptional regulator n=1 Tax=Eiseniibacteriota bacterium TaxID=2212470 RepID=A0A937XAC2_UNCEI|nr:sigma-54-dependent Fis family transcriptional regulator [Candidatus Eisenbacteria bacterium]